MLKTRVFPVMRKISATLCLFTLVSSVAVPHETLAQAEGDPAVQLQPFVVSGERAHASDVATHDVIDTYDATEVEGSGAFTVEEFIGTLPESSEGDEVLVLINGIETTLNLAALSPAMIEAIEVSNNGSMPQHGAYARGRVINIKLKSNYNSRELGAELSGSIHGDGLQRQTMFSGGAFRERWRVMYSLKYSEQDAVMADERDFSREQDRRANGGRDFRTPWGEAPVIRAASGFLPGVFDENGNAVSIALIPDDFIGAAGIEDLIGADGAASGQRYFNTSPYLYLASPSERLSSNFQLNYTVSPKLNFELEASVDRNDRVRHGPPPVTAASRDTRIPGALNPFGTDIEIGLVHTGFGPVINDTRDTSMNVSVSADGKVGDAWRWNAQLAWRHRISDRSIRDLDPEKLAASLADPNVNDRFDPFDLAANADLYPELAVNRVQDSVSNDASFRIRTSGALWQEREAGPIKVAASTHGRMRSAERTYVDVRGQDDGVREDDNQQYSVQGYTELPIIRGERAWMRRLDSRVHGEYSQRDDGSIDQRLGFGMVWSPARPLVFRASYDQSVSEPGDLEEEEADVRFASALMDPLRTPAIAQNVQVITRRDLHTKAGESEETEFSVSFEPTWARGLRMTVEYEYEVDRNAGGFRLSAQDAIDNETLFIGRILRADPTASDLALGQPGAILAVDTTPVEVLARERERLDFKLEYRIPEMPIGRFHISATAAHMLDSRYQLEGGTPVFTENDRANPPDWTGRGSVNWQRQNWSASTQIRYTAATEQNALPAITDVSATLGYRFDTPVFGKYGKGLQIRGGIRNALRDGPYLADTLLGYRGGSVLGQMLFFSARLPI